MVGVVLMAIVICGGLLVAVRDRPARGDAVGVDRGSIRRTGWMLVGLGGTALLGWLILNVLASWVAKDL